MLIPIEISDNQIDYINPRHIIKIQNKLKHNQGKDRYSVIISLVNCPHDIVAIVDKETFKKLIGNEK